MTTKPKSTTPSTPSLEEITAQVTTFNEKAVASFQKAGAAYLNAYETAVTSFVDSYEKAATESGVQWLADAAPAQAEIVRELSKAGTKVASQLVG